MQSKLENSNFYVAPSLVAGLGLFAAEPLAKDNYLEVEGIVVIKNSLQDQCTRFANDYKFEADDEHFLIPIGLAGMANHAIHHRGQNAEISQNKGNVRLMMLRDIKADEEILIYYNDMKNTQYAFDVIYASRAWHDFIELGLYEFKKETNG